jgi:hypothetical protein
MADILSQHKIGSTVVLKRVSADVAVTAGGAGNNVVVTGLVIDRMAFASGMPNTGILGLDYTATLGATNTVSFAHNTYTSPDKVTWTLFYAGPAAVASTGPTGGGTVTSTVSVPLDLTMALRYVRIDFTPTMSAANTDTANVIAIGAFGGFSVLPAPRAA